jgi:hypothetical protein
VLHELPPYKELQVQVQAGCRPLTEDAWLLQFAALVHGVVHFTEKRRVETRALAEKWRDVGQLSLSLPRAGCAVRIATAMQMVTSRASFIFECFLVCWVRFRFGVTPMSVSVRGGSVLLPAFCCLGPCVPLRQTTYGSGSSTTAVRHSAHRLAGFG